MANPLWVEGKSGNPSGRPKGSKRTFKRTVDRWFVLDINLKELRNIYQHLKPGKEQLDMVKSLLPFHIPTVAIDSLTPEQIDDIYSRLENKRADEAKKVG